MGESRALDAFMILGAPTKGGGSQITGESQDAAYGSKGAIEIDSFKWSIDNGGGSKAGAEEKGGAESSGPKKGASSARSTTGNRVLDIKAFTVTKTIDIASPALLVACCDYTELSDLKIILRKGGTKTNNYFTVFYFTNVYVESIDWSVTGPEPEETLQFSCQTCQLLYRPQVKAGTFAADKTGGWNLLNKSDQNPWGNKQVPSIPKD